MSSSRAAAGRSASRAWKPRSIRDGTDEESGAANPLGRREFQQRQRVPARLGQQPGAHLLVERHVAPRRQQLPRVGVAQPVDVHARQPGQRARTRRPDRDHHRDALGADATGEESQCLGRLRVQPLRVVDDAQQRAFRRRGRQQRQGRQADAEQVRGALGQPERDAQGVAVPAGQVGEPRQHRHAHLVQRGERQLRLELGPVGPHDPEPGRLCGMLQQRALADPRLTAEHEHAALAHARRRRQLVDPPDLGAPPEERSTGCAGCPHPANASRAVIDRLPGHLGDYRRRERPSAGANVKARPAHRRQP